MAIKITIIILTKNSQKYLKNVLDSLKEFEEILIIDNGSTDNTLNITNKFKNTKIIKEKFIGFGPLKNKSLKYTKNEWVLFIDSDEIVKKEMIQTIKKLNLSQKNRVYSFLRDNYYKDKLIKCCGWENDYVIRLFNKTYTKFNNNLVHESVIIKKDTKLIRIKDGIKHYAYSSIDELIEKMQKYSSLFAKENNYKPSFTKLIISPLFKFIKNYFFQKGFLYGYIGFTISLSNANGVIYKYLKLYEKVNQNES